jgi:AraC family transcriptional regulator
MELDVYCNGDHVGSEVGQNTLVLPSKTAVSVHTSFHKNCEILAVKMTDEFLESCSATDRVSLRPALNRADEMDWQIARLIYQECSRGGQNGELFARSAAIMLGISLVRQSNLPESSPELAPGGLSLASLRHACEFMEDRLETGVALSEVAAATGLSVGHFASCFKRSTGLAPYAWLRQKRMERAKQLLGNAYLQLEEIAIRSGFSNQSAFGVAFRRETGVTPTQWRRQIFK